MNQREFVEPIRWNLILFKNSARRGTHTLDQKSLPRSSQRIEIGETWQTCLHRAVGCLFCQYPPWLRQPDWHCNIPPIWTLRPCRYLTISQLRGWSRSFWSSFYDLTTKVSPTRVGIPDGLNLCITGTGYVSSTYTYMIHETVMSKVNNQEVVCRFEST